jgi:hypothetical protein
MFATLALATSIGAAAIAGDPKEPAWEESSTSKGVTVMMRERKGTDVKEILAVGEVGAPPRAVFRAIGDYQRYKEIMPYTEESKVVASEQGEKVVHVYSRINAPLVSRRDYTMRIVEVSDFKDGKGYLGTRWTPSEKGPAAADGVVRVKVNEGSWRVEPLDGGARSRVTYFLFTDPGGSLPAWIKNSASSGAIPDMFEALRRVAPEERYRK